MESKQDEYVNCSYPFRCECNDCEGKEFGIKIIILPVILITILLIGFSN